MSKKKIIETEVYPGPTPAKVVEPTETKKSAIQPNEKFDNEPPIFSTFDKEDLEKLRDDYLTDLEDFKEIKAELERCLSVCYDDANRRYFGEQLAECCETIKTLESAIKLQNKYLEECTK